MVRSLRIALGGALLALLAPAAALGQDPVEITTPYPAIVVDPGGTARFTLEIVTQAPERVDLSVTGAPDGWQPRLRGEGATVTAVYSDAVEPTTVELEIDVPRSAAAGEHSLTVAATSASGSASLALDITVAAAGEGAVSLTTQFPALRGPAGSTYQFNLELRNSTNEEITFSLEADGPPGWVVSARPATEEQAATAVVAAGATARVTVEAETPDVYPAGTYTIAVRAAGGPGAVQQELSVAITGSYSVELATQDGRLNTRVTVGSTTRLPMTVRNSGTAALENVALEATAPAGWTAQFEPPGIGRIEPNDSEQVELVLTPTGNAVAGDYVVTVSAESEQAQAQLELRTTVETSPIWGFVGIALLAAVALGLMLVFRRYGRR